MAGEAFSAFMTVDPVVTSLPLPTLTTDRIPIVRGTPPFAATYYVAPESIPAVQPGLTVVTPSSGDTVTMAANVLALYVNTGALAALTIELPPNADGVPITVELGFAAPIATLNVLDDLGGAIATAPTSGFGPGAAIAMKYVSALIGWVYWK